MIPFQSKEVEDKFLAYPDKARDDLILLRELIFQVANATKGVGLIEETLKWGEPGPTHEEKSLVYFSCA